MEDESTPLKAKDVVPTSVVYPILNSSNYTVCSMRKKVLLRVHKVWENEQGTTIAKKNDISTSLLFQSIPESLILQVDEQDSVKGIWEVIKSRHLGADRVKEARLQTLMAEFERMSMKETNTIDNFSGKLSKIVFKTTALGNTIEEPKMVKKFFNSLSPQRYIQIDTSLEQVLDLKIGFVAEWVKWK